MEFNTLRNLTLILSSIGLLTACGASKTSSSGSATSSSRGNPTTGDSGSNNGLSTSTVLSECNAMDKDGIKGQLTTYYDPSTAQFVETYIRMNITTPLSAMSTDGSHYVQIYRWHSDSTESRVVNQTPTKIYFVEKSSGAVINLADPANALSGATISNMIATYGLTDVTASNFYDKFLVVLGEVGFTYDAITIATYSASTNLALTTTDFLLPAFAADPNEYGTNHATMLQRLHPNFDEINGGFTQAQYKQMAEQPCQL